MGEGWILPRSSPAPQHIRQRCPPSLVTNPGSCREMRAWTCRARCRWRARAAWTADDAPKRPALNPGSCRGTGAGTCRARCGWWAPAAQTAAMHPARRLPQPCCSASRRRACLMLLRGCRVEGFGQGVAQQPCCCKEMCLHVDGVGTLCTGTDRHQRPAALGMLHAVHDLQSLHIARRWARCASCTSRPLLPRAPQGRGHPVPADIKGPLRSACHVVLSVHVTRRWARTTSACTPRVWASCASAHRACRGSPLWRSTLGRCTRPGAGSRCRCSSPAASSQLPRSPPRRHQPESAPSSCLPRLHGGSAVARRMRPGGAPRCRCSLRKTLQPLQQPEPSIRQRARLTGS